MSETYTEIDLSGETNGQPFLKVHYQEVSDIMNNLGYENDIMDMMSPRQVADVDFPEDCGITPNLSKSINKTIQNAQFPFTLEEDLAECFGDGEGSANVTTIFERTNMAIEEAFKILELSGQMEDALEIINLRRTSEDPDSQTILTYTLAVYSKGWRIERILNSQDRWKTGSVSQDKGGLDLYDRELDMWIQLKPFSVLGSRGPETFKAKDHKHLFWFVDSQNKLIITDADGYLDVKNRESDRTDIPGTLFVKARKLSWNREYGRSFRFVWW